MIQQKNEFIIYGLIIGTFNWNILISMKPYQGYSNRNENKLEAGEIKPEDRIKIRLAILKAKGNRVVGDCEVGLKSPSTFNEIITPVRNSKCNSTECLFDLEETLDDLQQKVKKDNGELVYFCPNCISSNTSNKRLVKDLYFDRQAMSLIAIAKAKYAEEAGNNPARMNKFKNGILVFKKSADDSLGCTFVLSYKEKNKKEDKLEEKHFKIPLQIGEKASNNEMIKFYMNDKVNVQGMKSSYQKIITEQSKLFRDFKNFAESCTTCSKGDIEKIEAQVAEKLGEVVNKYTEDKSGVNENYFTEEFTFTFSKKGYMEPANSLMTVLNVFFPRLRLWRSFRLQTQQKTTYSHPEGAVYLKQGYKIYVIGGYKPQFPLVEKTIDPKDKTKQDPFRRDKKADMTNEVTEIDLSTLIKLILEPTRSASPEKTGSMIRKSSLAKPVIDKMFKEPLLVKKLAPLPKNLCNSAGGIINNCIYVFGGCTVNFNQGAWNEVTTGESYCYNIAKNAWSPITSVPTPRSYHSVVKNNKQLYIIGGSKAKDKNYGKTNDQSAKEIDIYNTENGKYTSELFIVNNLLSTQSCSDGFRSRALPLRYPLDSNEFLFITGDKNGCYSFNIDTKKFSFGGPQAEYNVLLKQEKSLEIDLMSFGPKLQQIFDYSPPFVNGCYYYGVYSLLEKKNYVVYGIKGDWGVSEEYDMGLYYKKQK